MEKILYSSFDMYNTVFYSLAIFYFKLHGFETQIYWMQILCVYFYVFVLFSSQIDQAQDYQNNVMFSHVIYLKQVDLLKEIDIRQKTNNDENRLEDDTGNELKFHRAQVH